MSEPVVATSAPSPEELRPHYGAFLREGRILLTGHSHQAWPDCAREALVEAFDDASGHVDDKWSKAMAKAEVLRAAIGADLGAPPDQIALGQNSHELVTRFLSTLPLRSRPHLVTTAGEFHSIDRQLRRLGEEGVRISFVPVTPIATLAERMGEAIDDQTAAVLASTVLFQTAQVVPNLPAMVEVAHRRGAQILLDSYHAFKVVPRPLSALGLDPLFVTGGGYKYAQWGEGCCWLRVPPGREHRPVYTGWFSNFAGLEAARTSQVQYGTRGADQFAGSTYDPCSHYRAARVIEFFHTQGLDQQNLRQISLRQTRLIMACAKRPAVTPIEDADRGGFVAFATPNAQRLVSALRAEDIFADARGHLIRFGPAPYLCDHEIKHAIERFNALVDTL